MILYSCSGKVTPCRDVDHEEGFVLAVNYRQFGASSSSHARQHCVGGGDAGELGRVPLGRGSLEELDAIVHGLVADRVVPAARHCHGRVGVAVPAGSTRRRGLGRLAAAAGGALHGGP